MEHLDRAIIITILEYLNLYEIAPFMQTCKGLNTISQCDYLWKKPCLLLSPDVVSDFYRSFIQVIYKFQSISTSFYDILSVASKSPQQVLYKSMLLTSNPELSKILAKYHCSPTGSNDISQYANHVKNLPIEFYWLYLLYNGQGNAYSGLFGSYEFYDVDVKLQFKPASQNSIVLELASSRNGEMISVFVDVSNRIGKGLGCVYCSSGIHNSLLYLSPSLSSYLETLSQKLKTGKIRMLNEQISLYESNEYSSTNTSNGIKLSASALYVPHLSTNNRYLWSYQITIASDEPEKEWKLTTRTWKIQDSNGEIQTVNRQPGVIGLYPKVYKGSEPITYTSCSYLKTTSGVMSGFFTFKQLQNPQVTIDVEILPFRLELPIGSELINISD